VAILSVNGLPSAPTNFTASEGTYRDRIQLTWSTVTNAVSYVVYRSTNNTTNAAVVLSDTTETIYDDTDVVRGVRYYYWVVTQGDLGLPSDFSVLAMGWRRSAAATLVADYDGDGKADPAQYYEEAASFGLLLSGSDYTPDSRTGVGGPGYVPASADYDGDGLADPAAYDETTGTWVIMLTGSANSVVKINNLLGAPGCGPTPADFDGDRKADPAIYQEATGNWMILLSGSGYYALKLTPFLGGVGYSPAAADFDGDKKADPAVYAESTGDWIVLLSSANYFRFMQSHLLGGPGFTAVPADYDGDGLADPAVHDETTGQWRIMLSSLGYYPIAITLTF
jgi:hypothetical protein